MAKYVARVRKDANSYRYFYSPAEYQAYLKSKGNGKTLGEKAASAAVNLTGAVTAAKKKVRKYVYNKNAEKKLNEMGKAHELDERSKQNARMKPEPGSHRDNMTDKSTVNRRTIEAVYGGQLKKSGKRGEGYVHTYSGTTPKTTEANVSTPNVGKMQDAINKQASQSQSEKKKKAQDFHEKYVKAQQTAENQKTNRERSVAAGEKAKAKAGQERQTAKRREVVTKRMTDAYESRTQPSLATYIDKDYNETGNVVLGVESDQRYKQSKAKADAEYSKFLKKAAQNGDNFTDEQKQEVKNSILNKNIEGDNRWAANYFSTPRAQAQYAANHEAISKLKEEAKAKEEAKKKKKYVK